MYAPNSWERWTNVLNVDIVVGCLLLLNNTLDLWKSMVIIIENEFISVQIYFYMYLCYKNEIWSLYEIMSHNKTNLIFFSGLESWIKNSSRKSFRIWYINLRAWYSFNKIRVETVSWFQWGIRRNGFGNVGNVHSVPYRTKGV